MRQVTSCRHVMYGMILCCFVYFLVTMYVDLDDIGPVDVRNPAPMHRIPNERAKLHPSDIGYEPSRFDALSLKGRSEMQENRTRMSQTYLTRKNNMLHNIQSHGVPTEASMFRALADMEVIAIFCADERKLEKGC